MSQYLIEKNLKGLLKFTINKSEKRNAICYNVMDGLQEALNLARAEDVKVLAITGAGDKAFCSGGDLSVFHALKTEGQAYGMLSRMSEILYELMMFPKPTIAVLNGTAVGGGCELAAACDFRIGRENIKAGFVQGKLAITTGWGGGTMVLEKLPVSNAFKMLSEARVYSAGELLQLGFLDDIYEGDADGACEKYLEHHLMLDHSVLASYKNMLVKKWSDQGVKARIDLEIENCARLWASDLHHQKVEEFLRGK